MIYIREIYLDFLVERFLKEVVGENIFDVVLNFLLKDENVVNVLIKIIEKDKVKIEILFVKLFVKEKFWLEN